MGRVYLEDSRSQQSDTRSVAWRDNISSCSSMAGHSFGFGIGVGNVGGGVAASGAGAATGSSSRSGSLGAAGAATEIRECPLCYSECKTDMFQPLRNCPHLFCLNCLRTYVRIEIQEGRVNLKCPQCNEFMHPNGKKGCLP